MVSGKHEDNRQYEDKANMNNNVRLGLIHLEWDRSRTGSIQFIKGSLPTAGARFLAEPQRKQSRG